MKRLNLWIALALSSLLMSCAPSQDAFDFRTAVTNLSNDLVAQFQIQHALSSLTHLAANNSERDPNLLVLDPFVDGNSGAQNQSSVLARDIMTRTIESRAPSLRVVPLSSDNARHAGYVIVGSMGAERHPGGQLLYRLHASIVDLSSGNAAANSSAWIADSRIPSAPIGFYRRAPMFMQDSALDSQLAAASAARGSGSAVPYVQAMEATAITADGEGALDSNNYSLALSLFTKSASMPGGQTMKNLYGRYQALYDGNRRKDAAGAFYDLISLAVSHRDLNYARFLFTPGKTDFLAGTDVNEYNLWLKEFAKFFAAHGSCVVVVGNASTTGQEETNVHLSDARAGRIMSLMIGYEPSLSKRLGKIGRGSADCRDCRKEDTEATDIDRRVEFRLGGCT